ncbi:Ig-like domain-containing protein [Agreia pratensis]|uniref:Ig-like domain-containing protein n=1 Tax=Agreia pratensis TaxID=150121 RepID=UPI00188D401B|nr:Ig-like domain-containing protein [Agreia pratensis]MBF4635859.1 Ig-like domain-containing protein [Agreia pratensis]
MSTDNAGRRFRRLLYGSITVVSVMAAALVVANFSHGPQLQSAQINVNTAVERSGQRLLLQANEPLDPSAAGKLTVSPAAAATATVDGDTIDVQFTGILSYNTRYTVTVPEVRSVAGGGASTLGYTFTTANPTTYFLSPSKAGEQFSDAVLSAPIGGGAPTPVYQAPRIRQFVALGDTLVVDTVNDDGTDALTIVSLTGAAPIVVNLAGSGTITSLKADPTSKLFGYTFTPQPSAHFEAQPDQLYVYDITRGNDYSIPITGTDFEVLTAKDWMLIPGTTSLVAQTESSDLLLVDTLGERDGTSGPVPIGRADSLVGFVPTTKTLITATGGARTATDFAQPEHPSSAFPSVAGDLGGTDSAIVDVAGTTLEIQDSGHGSDTTVSTLEAGGSSALFSLDSLEPAGQSVTSVCVAPNGLYAAITTSAQQITYVDLADGKALSTVDGRDANWCSAR